DPRRTKTAEEASAHVSIRPGADPFLLAAMLQELFAADRVDLGTVAEHVARVDELRDAVAPFSHEAVAGRCGISAEAIRGLAHELADAPTAVVYARIGTTVSPYGTVTSWLVDALNICTG